MRKLIDSFAILALVGLGGLALFTGNAPHQVRPPASSLLIPEAEAHSGQALEPEYRTAETTVRLITTSSGTDTEIGKHGVVWAYAFNNLTKFSTPYGNTKTATVAQPPYPTRLWLKFVNGGGSLGVTAMRCTIDIAGTNALGRSVSERIALTGALSSGCTSACGVTNGGSATTTESYEQVTSIVASSCTGSDNASDVLRIQASRHVGLPLPIRRWSTTTGSLQNNLLAVCRLGDMTTAGAYDSGPVGNFPLCARHSTLQATGALNTRANTIDPRYGCSATAPTQTAGIGGSCGIGAAGGIADIASAIYGAQYGDLYRVRMRGTSQ